MRRLLWVSVLIAACGGGDDDDDDTSADAGAAVDALGTTPDAAGSSACARAFACAPTLERITEELGADVGACEQRVATGAIEPKVVACLDAAADCDGMNDCLRCLGMAGDTAFCSDVCPFVVDTCGLATDVGQCTIDCENVAAGALGCFPGYERACWIAADDADSCADADACEQIAF